MYFKHFDKTFNDNTINHWVVGDPHYGHRNLVEGISNWSNPEDSCRPFKDLPEHNKAIVDGINSVVKSGDILWLLGDWCFGGIKNVWEFRKQLNCENIYFILGNHDKHIRRNKSLIIPEQDHELGLDECQKEFDNWGEVAHYFEYNGTTWKSYYDVEQGHIVIPAQELFNWVAERIETKIFGQRVIFDHFAKRVWNKSHHGTWLIHGHSHDSLPDYTSDYTGDPGGGKTFRTMDVGFESAYRILGEWRPFKFQEIQTMMQKRPMLQVDHHNQSTNE